jgi:hypothetical protein
MSAQQTEKRIPFGSHVYNHITRDDIGHLISEYLPEYHPEEITKHILKELDVVLPKNNEGNVLDTLSSGYVNNRPNKVEFDLHVKGDNGTDRSIQRFLFEKNDKGIELSNGDYPGEWYDSVICVLKSKPSRFA